MSAPAAAAASTPSATHKGHGKRKRTNVRLPVTGAVVGCSGSFVVKQVRHEAVAAAAGGRIEWVTRAQMYNQEKHVGTLVDRNDGLGFVLEDVTSTFDQLLLYEWLEQNEALGFAEQAVLRAMVTESETISLLASLESKAHVVGFDQPGPTPGLWNLQLCAFTSQKGEARSVDSIERVPARVLTFARERRNGRVWSQEACWMPVPPVALQEEDEVY
jgi:hypothetical protein